MIDSTPDGSVDNPRSKCFDIDLLDLQALESFFNNVKIDVVIHCAGVSRQVFSNYDYEKYRAGNVETTKNIAQVASRKNPATHFIFLSSVLVYGETLEQTPVNEDARCFPACEYSRSKFEAENYLKNLFESKKIQAIDILRLAQVYDKTYTDNLDKRVFAPYKLAYLKFGLGHQKMSALSRKNLKNFILFLIENQTQNLSGSHEFNIYNITDKNAYSFVQIIKTFKSSKYQPTRFLIPVPLWVINFFFRLAGFFLKGKKNWLHSCYNKLSLDFIYDNTKMLGTGFVPEDNLNSVFLDNTIETLER